MVRKRFNKEEKALIESGVPLQWQNVTQWHDCDVKSREIVREGGGWEHITAINRASTDRLSAGDLVYLSPGHVRTRPEKICAYSAAHKIRKVPAVTVIDCGRVGMVDACQACADLYARMK